MKERLKILLFSIFAAASMGIIDYLIGLYYGVYELRSIGPAILVLGLAAAQLWYMAVGSCFGLLMAGSVSIFASLQKPKESHLGFSGIILAVLAGVFAVLGMEAFTKIHTNWKLFLDFLFFLPLGVLVGLGAGFVWETRIKDFFGGPLKAILSLYLSFLFSAGFSTLWVMKGSLSFLGKMEMVLIAGAIFAAGALLSRRCFLKKSPALISIYVAFALLLLSLPVWGLKPKPQYKSLGTPKNRLNVIFIIADACRADALSVYGGKNPTPNLDRLAGEGVLFKHVYTQAPWTLPSMLSMLSSLYPSIFNNFQSYQAVGDVEFFPERLKGYGYYTEAIIANSLLGGNSGVLQGFDRTTIKNHRYRLQTLLYHPVLAKTHYLGRRLMGLTQLPDLTEMMTRYAQESVKSAPQPFFLYLHHINPHEPYNPPAKYLHQINYKGFLRPPFNFNDPFAIPGDYTHPQALEVKLGYVFLEQKDKDYIHDLYLGQFRYLDEKIGELVRTLKKSGLDKNTVIVFTSDHGEEFWEHDNVGHGASLFDELVHVPLIIWGGGLKPRVIEKQVESLDLVPSLAELLGVPLNPAWQGKSFHPALESGGVIPVRPVFSEGLQRPEEMKSIRTGAHKLIVYLNTRKVKLFDLKQDPLEQTDISAQKPELTRGLYDQIMDWSARNLTVRSKYRTRPLTAAQRREFEERLRAAGYLK